MSVLATHTHTHTHTHTIHTCASLFNALVAKRPERPHDLPSSSNLTSLAALTPSSFRFFSIACSGPERALPLHLTCIPLQTESRDRDSCIPNIRLCPTLSPPLACSVCRLLLKHPSPIEVRYRLALRPLDWEEVAALARAPDRGCLLGGGTSSSHPVVPS